MTIESLVASGQVAYSVDADGWTTSVPTKPNTLWFFYGHLHQWQNNLHLVEVRNGPGFLWCNIGGETVGIENGKSFPKAHGIWKRIPQVVLPEELRLNGKNPKHDPTR